MTPISGLRRIVRERSRASVKDFWRDYKGFIAWVVVILVIGVSQIQIYIQGQENQNTNQDNQVAIAKIEEERSSRINTINSVNVFFCQQNNKQDKIIGKLLSISVGGAPPASALTSEQRKQLKEFERAERDLNTPTDCRELAVRLATALGIPRGQIKINPIIGVSINGLPNSIPHLKKGGGKQGATAPAQGGHAATHSAPSNGSPGPVPAVGAQPPPTQTGPPAPPPHHSTGGGAPTSTPTTPAPPPAPPVATPSENNGNGNENGRGGGPPEQGAVGAEAPALPVQACVGHLVSVNCHS